MVFIPFLSVFKFSCLRYRFGVCFLFFKNTKGRRQKYKKYKARSPLICAIRRFWGFLVRFHIRRVKTRNLSVLTRFQKKAVFEGRAQGRKRVFFAYCQWLKSAFADLISLARFSLLSRENLANCSHMEKAKSLTAQGL